MSPEDLKFFKELLLKKREETLDYLQHSSMTLASCNEGKELSNFSDHMADVAGNGSEEVLISQVSRESRYLHHIDEALERIKKGTYGICRNCGKEISKDRLEAVPTTTQCMSCKRKEEKRSKSRR